MQLLKIYLNDHLAGARAGLALAQRAAKSNRGTALGDDLERISAEILEDRQDLQGILEHFGFPENRVKQVVASAAEKAGRLKLNGRIVGYSPLSRLLELEALIAGVAAKRSLWRALQAMWGAEDVPPGLDLDRLEKRATSQLETLEAHRDDAAQNLTQG